MSADTPVHGLGRPRGAPAPAPARAPASTAMSADAPVRGLGRPRGAPAPAPTPAPAHAPTAPMDAAALRASVVSDEQLLAMKPLKPRKRATFEAATPSNYCHICSRTPNRGIRLAVCAALREGLCRKVVCERCFGEYTLGCSFEDAASQAVEWKCVHCQGICPERAQCRTYQNVNRKLRLQRLRQSVGPVESAAATATATAAAVAAGTAASAPVPRTRPQQPRKRKQSNADSLQGPARVHAQQTSVHPAAQPTQVHAAGLQAAAVYTATPAHVYTASHAPGGYAPAHVPAYPPSDSALEPSRTVSNAYTNRYAAAAICDKFPNTLSPKSIAAREPYMLESAGARQPQVERSYIRHTALSTASQDQDPLQRQAASAPRRTYRVCSTFTQPGPFSGATSAPTASAEKRCHLCAATEYEAAEAFTNCSGAMNPECRKTFCDRCMQKRGLQRSKAASEERGERWNCSHCTDICPTEAACYRGGARAVSSDVRKAVADTRQAKQGGGMSLKRRLLAAATVSE